MAGYLARHNDLVGQELLMLLDLYGRHKSKSQVKLYAVNMTYFIFRSLAVLGAASKQGPFFRDGGTSSVDDTASTRVSVSTPYSVFTSPPENGERLEYLADRMKLN